LISNHFRDSVGGPEKAGVGGSIPSLATNNFNNLQIAKNIQNSSREQYANIRQPTFAHCGSRIFQSSPAVPLVRQQVREASERNASCHPFSLLFAHE